MGVTKRSANKNGSVLQSRCPEDKEGEHFSMRRFTCAYTDLLQINSAASSAAVFVPDILGDLRLKERYWCQSEQIP